MERVARGFIAQERSTVFGGEDEMNVNGGKGLWHVRRMANRVGVFQSQRDCGLQPKVGVQRLPWVIVQQITNRNAVVANVARDGRMGNGRNRVAVGNDLRTVTQGSSCRATLGFGTQPGWDSRRARGRGGGKMMKASLSRGCRRHTLEK